MSLAVLTHEGLLARLELRYGEGFDLDPLFEFLSAEYGPGDELMGSGTWFWTNRSTRMFIQLGHRRRLVLEDPRR